jgi:hypothetical protein
MEANDEVPAAPFHPVTIAIPAAIEDRNRLTVAFRFLLAIPHVILVGGPIAVISCLGWSTGEEGVRLGWTRAVDCWAL